MPSPIVTKKLKETSETEERGQSEEETDVEIERTSEMKGTEQEQEGSTEEDPYPSLCSEEKEDPDKLMKWKRPEGRGEKLVTPSEVLGKVSNLIAGKDTNVAPNNHLVYVLRTGRLSIVPSSPDSSDQIPIVEVPGHKAHGTVPQPGSVVIARETSVMARMASADIMCIGAKFM
ncbi:uncharacterized protein LOC122655446 [Telopea speciosissima]|uniref:uncharacterized protein LOC122655446 n=1 Tax=Telopea speciosissima TaxID=54955 RepID=UPI001CC66FFE|nr:uncharacterized protein LOC122655446 [Telopea speciosissima]